MSIFNVAIIGVGKMGGALALALSEKGYEISELVTRKYQNARDIADLIEPRPRLLGLGEYEKITADLVFITTQDPAIQQVAEGLAEKLEHLPFVFHTSGTLSSRSLSRLSDEGCEVGSIHPLVSISDPRIGAERFKNAYFCIEGDSAAVDVAKQLVDDLEGTSFSIEPKYKPLYHASAVLACGHVVALISAAIETLSKCGLDEENAQEILYPLIKSTIDNLAVQTPAEALTGTFARADVETLHKHLNIMADAVSPEILKIYIQLGLRSIALAKHGGADAGRFRQMEEILAETATRE